MWYYWIPYITHHRKSVHNLTRGAPSPEIRTKPHKKCPIPGYPDKTSQEAPHPRKSGKNLTRDVPSFEIRTKPHKRRPIPGNPEQNLTRCVVCSDGCRLVGLRPTLQRPPAGAMRSALPMSMSEPLRAGLFYCNKSTNGVPRESRDDDGTMNVYVFS